MPIIRKLSVTVPTVRHSLFAIVTSEVMTSTWSRVTQRTSEMTDADWATTRLPVMMTRPNLLV